jgi:elongation factor P--(R)-beta-lysine ligase
MPASRTTLETRGRILRAVRSWFESEHFLEVETPARVRSPGQEVHLDAIPTGGDPPSVPEHNLWLVTSPEYHMKRLVAAGHPRIVQIGKCWRAGERGPHHLSEFTMIEWYRAGVPLETLAHDCEAIVRVALRAAGRDPAALGADGSFKRTTVCELFALHVGYPLRGDETAEALRAAVTSAGIQVGTARAWDDVFYQAFLDRIEPRLAGGGPTFVFDWPAPLGALARPKPGDHRLIERFELYAGGLELANAFGELTDPVEQRRRFEEESRVRAARGKSVYPIDEALLAALPKMPPTAGIALGFDRLVMLALGFDQIQDVVSFAEH